MSLTKETVPTGLLLGKDSRLSYYDVPDRQRWETVVPGAVFAVNPSGDGRYAVVALGDGTLRWYETRHGKEVLALYVHPDKRWVAWTPEGFYYALPGAESLIGYHLNQGVDHEGKFVKANQLKERYYQPNLIARRLSPEGDRLIAEAVGRLGDVRQVLTRGLPPKVELVSLDAAETPGDYWLKVRVIDQGGGIGPVSLQLDDNEVIQARDPGIPGGSGDIVTARISPPSGQHTIVITARNPLDVASDPISVPLQVQPRSGQPRLHLLAVGIRDYYNDATLARGVRFGAKDAQAMARQFQAQGAKLYAPGKVEVLLDRQATRDGIVAAMARFKDAVTPDDVFVLYLAGHGFAFNGDDYHFVPADASFPDRDTLRRQSLGEALLRSFLSAIKASKTLVMLDSCASAAFFDGRGPGQKGAIERLATLSGRAILAAAAEDKMALEGEGGHGVFTYALLEGLGGVADRDGNGTIEVGELADYVQDRVQEITLRKWSERQVPLRELNGASFPVLPRP
ncbi:caspase family protein [Methylomagnum ishizawai]|nr:caspase family protein [Methylomagnum ishizawai]